MEALSRCRPKSTTGLGRDAATTAYAPLRRHVKDNGNRAMQISDRQATVVVLVAMFLVLFLTLYVLERHFTPGVPPHGHSNCDCPSSVDVEPLPQ